MDNIQDLYNYNKIYKVINKNNNDKITIIIDSNKRDIKKYPSPFKFKILFDPLKNQENFYINKSFKNIKSFTVDKIFLPNRYYIKTTITNILPDENLIIDDTIFENNNYIENITIHAINNDYIFFGQ